MIEVLVTLNFVATLQKLKGGTFSAEV